MFHVLDHILDVLERQARSALIPDSVISTILGQLDVQISYIPMNCKKVVSPDDMKTEMIEQYRIIVGNTKMGFCNVMVENRKCLTTVMDMVTVTPVPETSNIIMANWSRTMWQTVVNRAVGMFALGLFGWHFFSAVATHGGN
ncbi:hypothetical protein KIN20_015831 [Parelaphostrongylus tenuis]|uniref:Uncharacterized protein n=1 Tax=Parelaphostrongylus tenuis TaxID=148309 RepID=A0AAD5N0S0_PARTN|nr:hypothetical protein KIN20_015831 [Parelaphostrongylus tenuis]